MARDSMARLAGEPPASPSHAQYLGKKGRAWARARSCASTLKPVGATATREKHHRAHDPRDQQRARGQGAQAFLAQAEHHPLAFTSLPPKAAQGPDASPALP